MQQTKKFLPVIIFLVVIIGVGILIFLLSDNKTSGATNNNGGNQPNSTISVENNTPIDNIDALWSEGNPNAKVKITEYSDFQCPFCKKGSDALASVFAKYKDQVYITFLNFPLTSIHENALPAARAAEAAGYQGKFWEMHDLLFANQNNLSGADFISYAKKLGLDMDKFESYFNNTNITDKILKQQKDIEGKEFDVLTIDKAGNVVISGKDSISGTPAFVINGKLVVGALPAESFEKIIIYSLQNAK